MMLVNCRMSPGLTSVHQAAYNAISTQMNMTTSHCKDASATHVMLTRAHEAFFISALKEVKLCGAHAGEVQGGRARAPSPPMSRLSSNAPGSNWMPPEPPADSARPTPTATSDAAAPAAGPAAATSSSVSLPAPGKPCQNPS